VDGGVANIEQLVIGLARAADVRDATLRVHSVNRVLVIGLARAVAVRDIVKTVCSTSLSSC
jgi:hypothetical protein